VLLGLRAIVVEAVVVVGTVGQLAVQIGLPRLKSVSLTYRVFGMGITIG
jgi:hypothetical protein